MARYDDVNDTAQRTSNTPSNLWSLNNSESIIYNTVISPQSPSLLSQNVGRLNVDGEVGSNRYNRQSIIMSDNIIDPHPNNNNKNNNNHGQSWNHHQTKTVQDQVYLNNSRSDMDFIHTDRQRLYSLKDCTDHSSSSSSSSSREQVPDFANLTTSDYSTGSSSSSSSNYSAENYFSDHTSADINKSHVYHNMDHHYENYDIHHNGTYHQETNDVGGATTTTNTTTNSRILDGNAYWTEQMKVYHHHHHHHDNALITKIRNFDITTEETVGSTTTLRTTNHTNGSSSSSSHNNIRRPPPGTAVFCNTKVPYKNNKNNNMIEVTPNVYMRLRGAQETWDAIHNDNYIPTTCIGCHTTVFCIQDAIYVLCPNCHTLSPLQSDTNDNNMYFSESLSSSYHNNGNGGGGGGVGLGFLYKELVQWQNEIISYRQP